MKNKKKKNKPRNPFAVHCNNQVFGTTSFSLTVEGMGPYPLSDSTNLLGPGSSSYGPGGVLGSASGSGGHCYTNYGTNLQTPQVARKCHYDEVDDYSFRRHSAHGRMSCRLTQHHR
ncbi:glucose transporter type 1-like [Drosophila yakuba]|uniref:glucose transporter type 1-like n=1 Tax=Drosophila yakuba TaxID=7245 RepID=UPI00193085BC|nr:glucose transporter type 1-like [Drosophila yakuba]